MTPIRQLMDEFYAEGFFSSMLIYEKARRILVKYENIQKEFAKQCFEAGQDYGEDQVLYSPNFEDFYKSLEK